MTIINADKTFNFVDTYYDVAWIPRIYFKDEIGNNHDIRMKWSAARLQYEFFFRGERYTAYLYR